MMFIFNNQYSNASHGVSVLTLNVDYRTGARGMNTAFFFYFNTP
jgi:hypothetical protein